MASFDNHHGGAMIGRIDVPTAAPRTTTPIERIDGTLDTGRHLARRVNEVVGRLVGFSAEGCCEGKGDKPSNGALNDLGDRAVETRCELEIALTSIARLEASLLG